MNKVMLKYKKYVPKRPVSTYQHSTLCSLISGLEITITNRIHCYHINLTGSKTWNFIVFNIYILGSLDLIVLLPVKFPNGVSECVSKITDSDQEDATAWNYKDLRPFGL